MFLLGACSTASPGTYEEGEEFSGGETTVFVRSQDAYSKPAANLDFDQVGDFEVGNNFNNDTWVVAPASTKTRDGLGPLYNATSCSACHFRDGRGKPPEGDDEMLSMLLRLSIPGEDEHGGPLPEPVYGGQLQPRSIDGVPAEASTHVTWEEIPGKYGDGTKYVLRKPSIEIDNLAYGPMDEEVMISPRVASPQYGLGLLEALAEEDVLARADPDDEDGDGISGRPNRVWDERRQKTTLGRFGWKANVPSILQQTAGALNGDIGISTTLFPEQSCTGEQAECLDAPVGAGKEEGGFEATDLVLDALVFYGQTLAVPGRRDAEDPEVLRGKGLFVASGCADCHVPSHVTGDHPVKALTKQRIWPYTDLLLHDMGDDLADHRPDFDADGSEWRTPPLWGIGLMETVGGHQFLLHDGRARGFAEAILWHGGEAEASREAFRLMPKDERKALLGFLTSL
jgi:CxxC motif-containing protein (DUF1111 family)